MIQQCIEFMQNNNLTNMVWLWHNCPLEEKYNLSHGGDEDYVILWLSGEYMAENVVHRLTVCGENTVFIPNTDYSLSVTAHG